MGSLPVYYDIMDSISREYGIDRDLLDKVISHECRMMKEKMAGDCRTIELSGFGKFTFNEKKAERTILRLDEIIELTEKSIEVGDESRGSRGRLLIKVHELKSDKIRIKRKIDEVKGNI